MPLPIVSGEFRLVADPDLRFAPSGVAVASFRVAANSRKKVDDEWVDDKVCWLSVTVFKQMAENVVESLSKGDLCFLSGRLQTEDWEDKEGNKRQTYRVVADTVGPALNFATAKVSRVERSSGGQSGGGGQAQRASGTADEENPWVTPSNPDDPPF